MSVFSYVFGNCLAEKGTKRDAADDDVDYALASTPKASRNGTKGDGGNPALTRHGMRGVVLRQDDSTTTLIIAVLRKSAAFAALSAQEGAGIAARDAEDGEKLQAGIDLAVAKGALPSEMRVRPYHAVDVLGKSADAVARIIHKRLPSTGGYVVALVGLSGTGKGTTVAKLQELIPRAISWSNGNIFRSLTLLAGTHCVQQGADFSEEVLTPGNIRNWMSMMTFGKFNDKFDIKVEGLGLSFLVSEVQNTRLKGPMVKRNIPTVAQQSQGEVISFAADALSTMESQGAVVLLEGRAQTVDYIPTPHRFELTLSDPTLIGQRRAAQRIAALTALELERRKVVYCVDQSTMEHLTRALDILHAEMETSVAAAKAKAAEAAPQNGTNGHV